MILDIDHIWKGFAMKIYRVILARVHTEIILGIHSNFPGCSMVKICRSAVIFTARCGIFFTVFHYSQVHACACITVIGNFIMNFTKYSICVGVRLGRVLKSSDSRGK